MVDRGPSAQACTCLEGGKEVVKIELPGFTVLKGKMSAKLKKILMELIKEGKV